jgi:hypothetical protein
VPGLAFVDDIGRSSNVLAFGLQLHEAIQFVRRKPYEVTQLANQSVLGMWHGPVLGCPPNLSEGWVLDIGSAAARFPDWRSLGARSWLILFQ